MCELHTVPGWHEATLREVDRSAFSQRQSHFASRASRCGAGPPTAALRRQLERLAQYEWG
jgi:hypothetical protein